MIAQVARADGKRGFPIRVLFLLVTAVLVVAAVPALAQDTQSAMDPPAGQDQAMRSDDSSSDPKTSDDEGSDEVLNRNQGEEIFVTARKREENVQDVPVAVTVTSGEELEDTSAPDISVLEDYVPNLSVYAGRNQSTTITAFMRGIGQADPLWGVDPGVGLYLDDVYIARPQGALLDIFDVDRVEVLRGPQGTLYGKNTIGGAIKYVSRVPTDTPEAKIALGGGNYNTQNVRALLSGPLVEGKLRGKVAVGSFQHDGYGENRFTGRDVSDKDSLAFRVALDWLPTDAVSVELSADGTRDDAQPRGYRRLEPNQFCPLFLGAPCPPLDSRYDTQSGLAPLNGTDSDGYALHLSWDFAPAWTFRSISAYRKSDSKNNIDFDTTPARITDVIATYYDKQWSQELQFVYQGPGRFNGVLGAYYFDGEAGGLVKNIFVSSIFGTTDGFTQTDSIAVFGDGTYALTDRLNLDFGLRYTDEKKRTVAFNAGYTDDTFSTVAVVTADFDKSKTFTSLAPRIGLDYAFTDNVLGYVTASRGFKSGGFNVRAQASVLPSTAEPFDDEVLDVLEVGLKTVLADHQLVFNTAAFYGDYSDIQVSTFTAYDSNGDGVDDSFLGDFLNAGDATLKGVEVELAWNPHSVRWFSLDSNLSYLDAKPDSFLDRNGDHFVDTQVITNAPKYTAGLRLRFNAPMFGGLFTAVVGGNYRDDSVLTNEGGPDPRNPSIALQPISQDAYGTLDASLNWFAADGRWGIRLNGYNLTDEEYLTSGYNIPVLGVVTGAYGPPATVIAGLEYKVH